MKKFELLKRTYPISQYNRICDGYRYIMENFTPEKRIELGIDENKLVMTIKSGERYIYQVAKENGIFKSMCLCSKNYQIIREKIFKYSDDLIIF